MFGLWSDAIKFTFILSIWGVNYTKLSTAISKKSPATLHPSLFISTVDSHKSKLLNSKPPIPSALESS